MNVLLQMKPGTDYPDMPDLEWRKNSISTMSEKKTVKGEDTSQYQGEDEARALVMNGLYFKHDLIWTQLEGCW